LPFEDNCFDWIFCNHVLEHIPDDAQAIRELYRVMKPGGTGIFQVPQDVKRNQTFEDDSIKDAKERARIFGQYDHVRVYGKDYFDKLRKCGFEVQSIDYGVAIGKEWIEKYRLSEGELLPVCHKPNQSNTL
jgi:ubiquinone/menaquinone biosynthesis C-methylase UbiE